MRQIFVGLKTTLIVIAIKPGEYTWLVIAFRTRSLWDFIPNPVIVGLYSKPGHCGTAFQTRSLWDCIPNPVIVGLYSKPAGPEHEVEVKGRTRT